MSLHTATSIGASFVVVDSSAPTLPSFLPSFLPSVRPSVPTLARGFLLAMGVKEEKTNDMGGHS